MTSMFSTLQFTDDQIILAQNKDDLERMTRKIKEEYEMWLLTVAVDKTQYMCIGSPQRNLLYN